MFALDEPADLLQHALDVVGASLDVGWVFVMKHLKLATIGVLYSVSMVLLLTAIGVVLFRGVTQLARDRWIGDGDRLPDPVGSVRLAPERDADAAKALAIDAMDAV